jgi:ligand-binding sensor domain-containing protein
VIALALVAGTVAACSGSSPAPGAEPQVSGSASGSRAAGEGTEPGLSVTRVSLTPRVEHVHGLVAEGDGSLLAGTHAGLFRVTADGRSALVGPTRADIMGLAIDRAGQLVASGHPEPGAASSNPVGLIRSSDGGRTWSTGSLSGEADFHALAARGNVVVGFDGAAVLVSSDGGKTWQRGQRGEVWSLTLDSRSIWATGPTGLSRSDDSGKSFVAIPNAPRLVLSTAGRDGTPWGIDSDGVAWVREPATGWRALTTLGPVEALAAVDADLAYAVSGAELIQIRRGGSAT